MHPEKQHGSQNSDTLIKRYEHLVTSGQINDDDAQRNVLGALKTLAQSLRKPSSIKKLFSKQVITPFHGLYMWGQVGRGKSMLMELFFDYAYVDKKRRVHFHEFMQEVHAHIHILRQKGSGDPVALLARQLAQEATLLCFDELQATDVTDATLLYRLFTGLFEAGVTIVSTSNRLPANLYTGGVQAERFVKFIELIESHMQVMALSSPSDYRMMQGKSLEQTWFTPLGPTADAFIADTIKRLCNDPTPRKETLSVQGRHTVFTLYDQAMGRFTFRELCETAMGPGDYLALAKRLETMILTDIPILSSEKRNEAKRFVTLIDELYEHKVRLIVTAAALPEKLYLQGDGVFEFKRTVSRLTEMQSDGYLEHKSS